MARTVGAVAGYRLYTDADLARLQQVLFLRELGLGLAEIKAIVDRPDFDRRQALLQHRQLLLARQERLRRLIQSVDRTLAALERGIPVDEKEMFDGFDQGAYAEEARQRWGHTEEYRESARRTARYTKADWQAIQQEGGAIYQGLAGLADRSPADPEVQELIRRHHTHINERFYTCSLGVYRGLGEMYVQDERFAAFFAQIRPGLAEFMQAAMHVYCDGLAAGAP